MLIISDLGKDEETVMCGFIIESGGLIKLLYLFSLSKVV